MGTYLPDLLGGYKQGAAAVYLVDYLKWLRNWPTYPKFREGKFRNWLDSETHASGAYGIDFVLEGLDMLRKGGHLKYDSIGLGLLEMTPEFVEIMRSLSLNNH